MNKKYLLPVFIGLGIIIVLFLLISYTPTTPTSPETKKETVSPQEQELTNQTKEFGAIYVPPFMRGLQMYNFSKGYLTQINIIIKTDYKGIDFCRDYDVQVYVDNKKKEYLSCEQNIKNNEYYIKIMCNIRTFPGASFSVKFTPKKENLPELGEYRGIIK